jgi:predicted PurR-regulated permease PerM
LLLNPQELFFSIFIGTMTNTLKIPRPVFYLGIIVLLVILLGWFFFNILIYFVISFVIATILRPFCNYLSNTQIFNFRVPQVVAVLISFLVLIVCLSLFITLFIPLVTEQVQVLTRLDYNELYLRVTMPLKNLEDFMIRNGYTLGKEGFIVDSLRNSIVSIFDQVDFQTIFNNLISFTGNFLIGLLAVVFITFFLLYEKGIVRKQFIALIPNQYFEISIVAIYKIEKLLSNYLLGLLFQMFAIFSIASFGLSLLGIRYALTIALFAAVSNLIPYAGPVLGAAFGVIVGVSTGDFMMDTSAIWLMVLKILAVFSVVQLTDNLLLQPLIFSKSVKAHPLEIFVIIFVGANLAGILGMIVAIPVYTVIKVSIKELYSGYKKYYIFNR